MKVQLERANRDGHREVTMFAGDCTHDPATLDAWIKMIQLAKRWLQDGLRSPQETATESDNG